jgi:hypothetical protein
MSSTEIVLALERKQISPLARPPVTNPLPRVELPIRSHLIETVLRSQQWSQLRM